MAESFELKYRAFISYSHTDSSWAKWLHRGLEGFSIDKDLVGRKAPTGAIPRALRPVFRDRDDFTAGQTLSGQTIDALDASQALIVICSPSSAGSTYVNEEIRLFRSRHPARPVIPLIVSGTPGDPALECFPTTLTSKLDAKGRVTGEPVELLAADARETGDGKRLALAKVVAGLLGLPADDVFRRAERARRRRVRQVAGLAMAVLAALLLLGAWAEIQRERFANYLDLATKFRAFQVADETMGWEDPHELAQDTLAAAKQMVSELRGFRDVRILWFDDKPALSQEAKRIFREGMQGIGVFIQEESDIEAARKALKENFDVVIANYGNPEDRFAYQLLAEISNAGLETPLVIYGIDQNPKFAKEARCYGAVARVTEIGPLFSAVIRALVPDTRPKVTDRLQQLCREEHIEPLDASRKETNKPVSD
jgi:hypothetical protein